MHTFEKKITKNKNKNTYPVFKDLLNIWELSELIKICSIYSLMNERYIEIMFKFCL